MSTVNCRHASLKTLYARKYEWMRVGVRVTVFVCVIVYIIILFTGMFPVGDTSCRTLIDVCVCVCVCQSVRRHIAKLRQE